MEILGGGGGLNNPFQKWFIQELILSHDSQELTGWRQARNANDIPDPAVYNPTARIVTVYPTPTRGQRKRFRIRAEGIPNEAYHSDFKEMEPHVCSNRLPNDCTNVMPNKTNAPPGGIIRLIFSGGGDPDNNLARYQARVMDESGALYNGGTPIGQQLDITKNYIDLTLSGDPSTFQAGTKWKFQVQGVDECEAGSWSIASPLVELRGITRVKVNGVWKQAIPYVKINGAWKQAVPYEKHNGTWEVAT